MHLSRLILNPRSREVRRDLASCVALHRTLLHAFPGGEERDDAFRARHGVLYRLESDRRTREPVVLVQSRTPPDWGFLLARDGFLSVRRSPALEVKEIGPALDAIVPGRTLLFRLRANPTRKVDTKTGPDGAKRNGKRVPIRDADDQSAWLARKGAAAGFELLSVGRSDDGDDAFDGDAPDSSPRSIPDVRARPELDVTGRAPRRVEASDAPPAFHKLVFGSVLFEGRLRVSDAAAFRAALEGGIGSGKAFGFGLLSVAPVPH